MEIESMGETIRHPGPRKARENISDYHQLLKGDKVLPDFLHFWLFYDLIFAK